MLREKIHPPSPISINNKLATHRPDQKGNERDKMYKDERESDVVIMITVFGAMH